MTLRRGVFRFAVPLVLTGHLSSALFAVQDVAGGSATPDPAVQTTLKRLSAEIFSGTANLPETIRELHRVLAAEPRSAEAHMLLGIAYRSQGSPEMMGESVAEFRQALELNPQLAPARLYLAYVYLDLGRPERAREELQAALAQVPGNVQFLALLAETERHLKNAARSVELLDQALTIEPAFVQARYYRGLALFDLGKRTEAIEELERVVQSGAKVADAYLGLGTAYLEAGRLDEGLEILSQATHIDPGRPDIRIHLARAYRLKGNLQKAEEQLSLATPASSATASPSSQERQAEFDLYLELGALRLRQGRLEAAQEALQKVLDMEPTHRLAREHMAEVKRRLAKRPAKSPGGGE